MTPGPDRSFPARPASPTDPVADTFDTHAPAPRTGATASLTAQEVATASPTAGDGWGERTLSHAPVAGAALHSAGPTSAFQRDPVGKRGPAGTGDPGVKRAAAAEPGRAANPHVTGAEAAPSARTRTGAASADATIGTRRRQPPGGARRVPFAVLLAGVVAAGMCGLLALNTATAASEVRERRVDAANSSLSARQQQLSRQVAAIQAPAELSRLAAKLGLVPAGSPAFLRLNANGTVTVLGAPAKVPTPPRPLTAAEKAAAKAAIVTAAKAAASKAAASKAAASKAAASKSAGTTAPTASGRAPTSGAPSSGATKSGTSKSGTPKSGTAKSAPATTGPPAPKPTSAQRTPNPPTPTLTVPGGPR